MTIGSFSLGLRIYQQQGQKSQEEELKGTLCTQHLKGMNRLFFIFILASVRHSQSNTFFARFQICAFHIPPHSASHCPQWCREHLHFAQRSVSASKCPRGSSSGTSCQVLALSNTELAFTFLPSSHLEKCPWASLVFLWLRLCTPKAVGTCSIPARGTKILQATQYNLKKNSQRESVWRRSLPSKLN